MRVLDRMVLGTFLKLFVIFAMGAPFLFVVGDITERIDTYADRGLSLAQVGLGYALLMPKFILWGFPIAGLVAAVFTVHAMTAHHEVVAAKAGGVSFHRLVRPILVAGLLLSAVGLGLTELVPRTNRRAAEVLGDRENRMGREWRANFVYQAEDGQTISVQRLTVADGRLTRVVLERPRSDGVGVDLHLIADDAVFDETMGWTFNRGYLRQFFDDGTEKAYRFSSYRTSGFKERPEELLEDPRDDEEMTYAELGRLAEIVRRSGGEPTKLLVKREEKLAIPMAVFVVVLFGLPLATTSKRGGASFGIGLALASTIFYMVLLRLSGSIGESGGLPPLAAAWIPNGVFLLVGLVLLARVRT